MTKTTLHFCIAYLRSKDYFKKFPLFWIVKENIHEQQVKEILTYQFEPKSGVNTNDVSDERTS